MLSLVLMVAAVAAAPFTDDSSEDIADLSSFYGQPDASTGERVAAWKPNRGINPEELGSYAKGDILIPREPPAGLDRIRNALVNEESRWPNAVVPYVINGTFTDSQFFLIEEAMLAIQKSTCVRFVEQTFEEDFITIDSGSSGCWSSVGRIGGNQVINLQAPACVWTIGTPIHELLHSLGLFHEQSRHDRDKYVQIFWHNLQNGQEHNFKKFDRVLASTSLPYDFYSVMHYSGYAFSKNNKTTIKPKFKGITLGQRDFISEKDSQKINIMYPCNKVMN